MHKQQTEVTPVLNQTGPVAPWWHTVLMVLLLIGGSTMSARQAHHIGLAQHHVARYATGMAAEWLMLLLVWWGLHMKHISLRELLGWRRGRHAFTEDLGAAAVFWMIAMVLLLGLGILLRLLHLANPQKAVAALAPRTPTEMLLWIALSLSAGFCEEAIFRGYFFRQFASPAGRISVGILCSSLLFGISHGYEGAAGMTTITLYGALFCGLALVRRTLRPGMMAHAWHDIFTGILLAFAHHVHAM